MGFYPKVETEEEIKEGESYMFVSNHTSMTDIMLMLSVVKNPFVFVGKKELAKIPLFGFFYKRTCILVDRSSSKSRMEVFERAQKRLNQGFSICIFPEGGVPDDESIVLSEFKDGAFRLALDHQIPIVPITFADNKKRFSYTFFSGSPGQMRVKIHHFFDTKNQNPDYKKTLKENVRQVILKQLQKFNP
jgi:1-acyl-sn-glycerol-3-phosphate acyltransferase